VIEARPRASTRRVASVRSIRFRIVAAFLAALLTMMGAQGFLILQQQRVARSLTLITEGYVPLAKIVTLLERDRQRVENDVQRLLRAERRPTTGPSSPALLYTEQLQENLAIAGIKAKYVQNHLELSAEDQAVFHKILIQLDLIETLFRGYQTRSAELVTLAEAGNKEGASALTEPLIEDGTHLGEEIDKLERLLESRVETLTRATEEAQVRAAAASLALTTVAVVFSVALILAVLVALRPIGRLTTEVQRLAAGDYGGRVEVRGADEIALLASEFNAMVRALQLRDRTLVERAEELNRLSRYLGSVLDSLEDALLVVEGEHVTLANPAAGRVWGAEQGAAPPDALLDLLENPGHHEVKGPGETLNEVRVAPFGDNGVVVVSADVTEQTRAKERLARSERLALIGQMLAQITHEVRNPLNALSLNAELLADELEALDRGRKTEAWDLLAIVSREIGRLTDVTAHYLQLARRPQAHLEPEDLGSLVRDVKRLLDVELSQRQVRIEVDPNTVPAQLVDGNQVRQALLNVVRNAVESGAHDLRLTVVRQDDEIHLVLRDDGPGMTSEEAERACDPFFSTRATGTGLGLAITKQILEDHDGTVRLSSAPGRGTTVILAFPNRPAHPETTLQAAD